MKTTKILLLAGISMVLAVGISACDKKDSQATMGESIDQTAENAGDTMDATSRKLREQSKNAGVALDDSAITAKVKAAILAETDLKILRIKVDTTNGVTTLSGSADSQQSSDRAKQIAVAVAGVREVDNQLVVGSTR